MKSINKMTLGELAAFIDSHLRKNGINVVLSGGASVAIYSDHKYVSKDIDFIARFTIDHAKVESTMKKLGFELRGKYSTTLKPHILLISSQAHQLSDRIRSVKFTR